MKIGNLYKLAGASILAAGLVAMPLSSGMVQAQDAASPPDATEAPTGTPGSNLGVDEESVRQAGQDVIQDIEEAGQAVQTDLQQAVQEATRTTQEATLDAQQTAEQAAEEAAAAAERAELAAQNAAEVEAEGFEWGWLGLLGLIGLFGLAGGNRRRVDVDERYHQPTTTTTRGDYHTTPNDYR